MKGNVLKAGFTAFCLLLLAAAVGLAMGTWGLPEENDLLFKIRFLRVSVSGIGAALSLLTLMAFAALWVRWEKKEPSPDSGERGPLTDAAGFGFLPSVAVWKCFESTVRPGSGRPVPDGLPRLPWITENGIFLPARLEALLALVLFASMALWLMLRKKKIPAEGDLAGISLTLWCTARLVTEGMRTPVPGIGGLPPVGGWLAAACMMICLIVWIVRSFRRNRHPGYAAACAVIWAAGISLIVLLQNGILIFGKPVAKEIIMICAALLSMKAVLCMGRISRTGAAD